MATTDECAHRWLFSGDDKTNENIMACEYCRTTRPIDDGDWQELERAIEAEYRKQKRESARLN